ncbi:acetylcholine-gated cation-selective channel [Branchiostoma belcheri]|nr:acetylcholine-gated cation-selective channel [Branchiostoma belcheri]
MSLAQSLWQHAQYGLRINSCIDAHFSPTSPNLNRDKNAGIRDGTVESFPVVFSVLPVLVVSQVSSCEGRTVSDGIEKYLRLTKSVQLTKASRLWIEAGPCGGHTAKYGFYIEEATLMVSIALMCPKFRMIGDGILGGKENGTRLYHHLFNHYNKALRPVKAPDDILMVEIGVTLTHIIDMNEKHQTLTANIWMTMAWNDSHLTWEPEEFGGFKALTLPAAEIWKPDIVLYQNVDPYFNGWSTDDTYIKVYSTGYVLWEMPTVTMSSCHLDVSSFPFDTQTCVLKFGPWIHSGNELDMRSMADEGSLESFIVHPEWEVGSFKAKRHMIWYGEDFNIGTPYADVTFRLVLKRKSTFYVFNLLLPCLLLTFVMTATFFLPSNCGEKLSFGVSLLLSMVVFQLVLTDVLPESDNLPWIGRFVIITMILMAVSLGMSVFVFLKYVATLLLMGDLSKQSLAESADSPGEYSPPDLTTLNSCVQQNLAGLLTHARRVEKNRALEREWRSLAKVLDRICMLLYLVTATSCLIAFATAA